MQVWRNCQLSSEETSESSAFLNAMYLLKYYGVPSKKPDYLNQGVCPLLRNDWRLDTFPLQRRELAAVALKTEYRRSEYEQFLGNG
jgi:hypothetical protein